MIEPAEIHRRQEQWRRAYLATPHGQPVQLDAAHHHEPEPRLSAPEGGRNRWRLRPARRCYQADRIDWLAHAGTLTGAQG